MSSAKLKLLVAASAGALTLWGCTSTGGVVGGTPAKAAEGIWMGATGPHPVQALPDRPRFGQRISEAELAAWNIDIRTSDGLGLPPGRGSVAEGKRIYDAQCAACHGADAKGGPVYGAMVGGIGSFKTAKRVLTPGSMYPYAPILFDYIRRSMPMDRPQTLSPNEVYALSAYLLNLNGLVPADAVMDQTSLPRVQMPNRDGFRIDDRPDTRAVRCMADCR
ncbi:MAG TPA: cytochrome c [Burkholderiales bacterium]|nr:cytochrome c [Burkholderiales bacterium]